MSNLAEDGRRYDEFESYPVHVPADSVSLQLRTLEWTRDSDSGILVQERLCVNDLKERNPTPLRITLAPSTFPTADTVTELLELFNWLNVPSDFLSERLQSVPMSFGARTALRNDTAASSDFAREENCIWFHFLCKSIPLNYEGDRISGPYDPEDKSFSGADRTWEHPAFFLKWTTSHAATTHRVQNDQGSNAQTSSGDRDSQCVEGSTKEMNETSDNPEAAQTTISTQITHEMDARCDNVHLVCFAAPAALGLRMLNLARNGGHEWTDVLNDPFLLIDLVLDELFMLLNTEVRKLQMPFNKEERELQILASDLRLKSRDSSKRGKPAKFSKRIFPQSGQLALKTPADIDFVYLSNIAKHAAHLKESSDATLHILAAIEVQHRQVFGSEGRDRVSQISYGLSESLRHRRTLFQSINLTLLSMEKRMQNNINLAFNLVTQYDSRIIQKDSKIVKILTLVTFFFLPVVTVATIFGTPFFVALSQDEKAKDTVRVVSNFWVFWVFAGPLSIVNVAFWFFL